MSSMSQASPGVMRWLLSPDDDGFFHVKTLCNHIECNEKRRCATCNGKRPVPGVYPAYPMPDVRSALTPLPGFSSYVLLFYIRTPNISCFPCVRGHEERTLLLRVPRPADHTCCAQVHIRVNGGTRWANHTWYHANTSKWMGRSDGCL